MPEPIYEYHLLYYSNTGKLEPPLGGKWGVCKSRLSRNALGATVLWRRLIEEPEKPKVDSDPCTLQVDCISGDLLCKGPYGPDKDHEHSTYKYGACSEYERKFSRGSATFREMLEWCIGFSKNNVESLPNGELDQDMLREVRLHVDLHGYPAATDEQKGKVETLFNSLYSKFPS